MDAKGPTRIANQSEPGIKTKELEGKHMEGHKQELLPLSGQGCCGLGPWFWSGFIIYLTLLWTLLDHRMGNASCLSLIIFSIELSSQLETEISPFEKSCQWDFPSIQIFLILSCSL